MLVYMIVMDRSRYQGSFGKKAMDLTFFPELLDVRTELKQK